MKTALECLSFHLAIINFELKIRQNKDVKGNLAVKNVITRCFHEKNAKVEIYS
jgi:hypothetical protein